MKRLSEDLQAKGDGQAAASLSAPLASRIVTPSWNSFTSCHFLQTIEEPFNILPLAVRPAQSCIGWH